MDIDGDIHTIKLILELPLNDDDKILVSLEFLNGICVLDLSIRADIQFPKLIYLIINNYVPRQRSVYACKFLYS